ncbi:signal peptidase II [Microbacterium rhizomatis]|uniref:Lipoprotein signal peptidase n=1 Tax=Microbacterium rhizomatis TaxID=1631477 RepID=A0A5J5J3U8_9MICO|nr:signal peptidase II [Microbacterium rhizomatis]KAA9110917.1 signal peptidase II [Microbacterium rhizomatis]
MTRRAPLRAAAAGTIIAVLAILVLAADQLAKYFAIQNLPPEEPVHVLGDFLIFYLIRNSGAAFSLGEDVTWIFSLALAAVAIAIVWLMITRVRSRAWAIVLGLLLGGVLGNLTDRLFRAPGFGVGHVVDFINTPWMMPAIYNVADMFIVTMMIGVAILVFTGLRFDGTRERRDDDSRAQDDEPAIDGIGDDRDPLFPAADPEVGAPGEAPASADPAKD